MKVKNLNTQKRELLIITSSIIMLIVLILVVFLFSRALSRKIEAVYTNPGNTGNPGQNAKIEEYNELVGKIFPNGLPASATTAPTTTILTP